MSVETVEKSYRLTSIQEGMLFHHLSESNSGVDIEQIVGVLEEDIETDAFREAWNATANRHAALRTAFRWTGGLNHPLQDVHSSIQTPMEEFDWTDLDPSEQAKLFDDFLAADRTRGFDLASAPLYRVSLFRLGPSNWRCVWTLHHIVMDGRSFPTVLKDVFATYEAIQAGNQLDLPEPRAFEEHINWLERRDDSGDEAFWRKILEDCHSNSPLPVTRSRDQQETTERSRHSQHVCLSDVLTDKLRKFAQDNDLTLNTLVQGAWAILLSRYTGEEHVIFGATRAGRGSIEGADAIVGNFINTIPVSIAVSREDALVPWLKRLRQQGIAVRPYEHTPLVNIQSYSQIPAGTPLFDTAIIFDHQLLDTALKQQGGPWSKRSFRLFDKTNFTAALYAYAERSLELEIVYDGRLLEDRVVRRMLRHLENILEKLPAQPDRMLREITFLTEEEQHDQLSVWNATGKSYPGERCIHQLFEEQVSRTPDQVAIAFEDRELTYRELNERANQLASHLHGIGVGPDVMVGICIDRSLEMIVGLLGILKAGGAYLPLDPEFPKDRLAFMTEDAKAPVLLANGSTISSLPASDATVVIVDFDGEIFASDAVENQNAPVQATNLAYVIYTSGSTGKPKGVMIEHRNVVNFFAGMDERIPHDPPGTWLAVTSLSFDISVLEIFWTLCRGFKVVVNGDHDRAVPAVTAGVAEATRPMDFSLFYFASDEGENSRDKYQLLLEGAKFADRNGFSAIWTPERHFHAFGGLYPNPAVAGAAVATITENIKIRSGSVVLPLHHPIRVAEEWALVDNLSGGRVGISFASGWQPDDFVLAPENYPDRKARMYDYVEIVKKLWRGEAVSFPGPAGKEVEIRTLPRPVQQELPVWITTAGSIETYRSAGAMGGNVLTHLLGQTVEELKEKIDAYRQAWRDAGHPGEGHVSLMLHTFVGTDTDEVRELVRAPMVDYLKSAVSLVKGFADAWTAFSDRAEKNVEARGDEFDSLSDEDLESLTQFAFERYFETSGLFGTPDVCLKTVDRIRETGVDEIACLIDFGVPSEIVLENLVYLKEVRKRASEVVAMHDPDRYSIGALLNRHQVTHLQCTPSQARMLLADTDSNAGLRNLQAMLVGGEALAGDLARDLADLVSGDVVNMYGPTETTIWSSTHRVAAPVGGTVSIGKPIANTDLYVLDQDLNMAPVGVVGELFIGGDGVARGYFNRPELTAERFVPHPFREEPSARLYRTGDLVRYQEDGTLDFVGRSDHQVKVLGHRIELGEIEATLAQNPAIRDAVVVARDDVAGGSALVGYYVSVTGASLEDDALKQFASEKLPSYMVPSMLVGLAELPLTPNGKVDRKALPAPERGGRSGDREFTAPRTAIEQTVAEIWSEVLGFEQVGVYDDFFQLGGNSLSTIQIAFKIRDAFQVDLPLSAIFRAPTVEGISRTIEEKVLTLAEDSDLEELLAEIE